MQEPTPDEIHERALEVRAGWSLRERRKNLCCIVSAQRWADWPVTALALAQDHSDDENEDDDQAKQ